MLILILLSFSAASANVPADYEQRIEKLEKLAEKFDLNKSFYMSHKYHEQNVRDDFIDKFFEVLGWDVTNKNQVLLYAQDSVLESRLKIVQTTKYVDYAFRIDGRNVFFVEAKAASKDIDNPDFIFQAKRYAWSSGNADIVVLTDYETFRVYDAQIKPDYYAPEKGEIKTFRMSYKDYARNFKKL